MTDEPFGLDFCSATVRGAKPSEVRKVFALSGGTGAISFASGMPDLQGLPYGELADIAAGLLRDRGGEVMQYGASTGTEGLKAELITVMRDAGIEDASAQNLVVTNGSQAGLDLLARLVLDPGDVVLAEAPSYSGGLAVFTGALADVEHVATDADGLIPEELEAAIARLTAAGKRVKLLYTIPSFHNPGGTVMPQTRRDRVREICAAAGVLIAEDDPYGELGFDGKVPRALRADDPTVAYLGSTSKMIGPGPRIGWALLPESLAGHFALLAEAACLNPSVLTQELVAAYLRECDWRGVLETMRGVYASRGAAMTRALEEHMPDGVTHTTPTGGFYIWLTLPETVDAYDLCMAAMERGVVIVPGTAFYVDGRGGHEARLSYCHPTEEKIAEGVAILARLIRERL